MPLNMQDRSSRSSPYYEDMDELNNELWEAISMARGIHEDLEFLSRSRDLDEPYKLSAHQIPKAQLKRLITLLDEAQHLSDVITDFGRLWSRSRPAQ